MKNLLCALPIAIGITLAFLPKIHAQDCTMDIGMNLYFNCYWSHELPFANLMVQAGTPWLTSNIEPVPGGLNAWNTEAMPQIPTDAQGYPLEMPAKLPGFEADQIVKTPIAFDDERSHPAGEYTVEWDGEGTVELFGPDVQSLVSQAAQRRVYFVNPPASQSDQLLLKIVQSKLGNHVRNLRVWLPGCSNLPHDFNPAFLEKLAPFKAVRTFNWHGTNDSKEEHWQNRMQLGHFAQGWLERTLPWEYSIRLCNLTQKDLWLCVPHAADSLYLASLARLLRDQLDPNLKIIVEYSNEVWSDATEQYHWVDQHAPPSISLHAKKYAWFAKRAHDIFTEQFAGQTERLVRVVSGQQFNPYVAEISLEGITDFGGNVDALTTTGYFGLTPASHFALNQLGNAVTVQNVADRARIDIENVWKPATLAHALLAENTVGGRILFYESGAFVSPADNATPAARQAILDFQNSLQMGEIYDEWLDFLRDEVKADLVMPLTLADDNAAAYGSFGHLNNVFEQPPFPVKYQTLLDNLCATIPTNEPTVPTGILLVSPNPTSGEVLFFEKNEREIQQIRLFNAQGKLVAERSGNGSDQLTMDIAAFPSGVYWATAVVSGGAKSFARIVRVAGH